MTKEANSDLVVWPEAVALYDKTIIDRIGEKNFGAILGGFVVWFLWIEAAPIGLYLVNLTTAGLEDTHFLKVHLIESVPYFRFLMMGIGLLLIMRYRPKGILPEKIEIK